MIFDLPRKTVAMDARGLSVRGPVGRSAIDTGMIFLVGELEKRDPKIREPLTSVTWPRDIPVRTGGGFVEEVTNYDVDYATTGGNNNGIMGNQTNLLPIMQADFGRDAHRVFNWAHILKVPFIDNEKLQKIGRSLDDILDKGIRLAQDKIYDTSVYVGLEDYSSYGLVNSPLITTDTAPVGAGGGSAWAGKTNVEIMSDINLVLNETWEASEYDLTGMANHILVPPKQYAYINNTPVTEAGSVSILTYLLENNIAKNQGRELVILPSRWCTGAGTGGADRLIAYANDEDRVRFDITQSLQRVMTQADANQLAYLTPYVSQFSEVQWLYTTHGYYLDGI